MTLVEAFVYPDTEADDPVMPKRSRPSLDDDPTIPIITGSRPTPAGPSPATTPTVGGGVVGGLGGVGGPGGGIAAAGGLSQALTTAIKCWDILKSYDQLRNGEFIISI